MNLPCLTDSSTSISWKTRTGFLTWFRILINVNKWRSWCTTVLHPLKSQQSFTHWNHNSPSLTETTTVPSPTEITKGFPFRKAHLTVDINYLPRPPSSLAKTKRVITESRFLAFWLLVTLWLIACPLSSITVLSYTAVDMCQRVWCNAILFLFFSFLCINLSRLYKRQWSNKDDDLLLQQMNGSNLLLWHIGMILWMMWNM